MTAVAPMIEAQRPRGRLAARARAVGWQLGRIAVSLWALATLTFLMVHMIPGDPVRASLGLTAPAELVAERRAALGLDQPLIEQYAAYMGRLSRGDLGTSFMTQLPVTEVIGQRLVSTLLLGSLSLLLVMVVGVSLGLWVGIRSAGGARRLDGTFNAASGVVTAMPEFITSVMLTALFAVTLKWLPVAGQSGASSYVLPVLALSAAPAAALARIVRLEALNILELDYMRTARAKRLGWRRLYLAHLLPNCLTATLAVSGLLFSGLIAGTVLVENIFAWPGLGSAIVLSILQKDYPLTQGLVLVFGVLILLINLGVDLLIALFDPRSALRHG